MNPPTPPSATHSVAVVGGGMLGVALALRLSGAGRSVTLFEAGPELGGLAGTWHLGDLTWDRYYHVTLASDDETRALLAEIGVAERWRPVATSTGYWDGTRVWPAATIRDFFALPGLGPIAKVRIGATIWVNARRRDWRRIERIAVGPWLQRWSGRAATRRFWEPQLRAKLGEEHADVAASFLWATFRRLDGARRGAARREQMGHVDGGYASVLAAAAVELAARGVVVHTGARVEGVAVDPTRVVVRLADGRELEELAFDDVVITAAAPIAARLLAGVDDAAARRFASVRTMGVVCASVLLDRPLSPHYLTYLAAPSPLTAVVDMSAMVPADALRGRGLVYLPRYLPSDDPGFEVDDDELRSGWLAALGSVYPELADRNVEAFAVARARHVFVVPRTRASQVVPPLTTAASGVHVVNSAHLFHATLNVDETVGLANWAAGELVAHGRIDVDRLVSRG